MGLIGAAFGLGFIFGPAIGGLLTHPDLGKLGYQLPIFTASGLCLLAAIGVAVLLKESRVRADPAAPRPAFLGGVRDAVANPVVSRVLLVTLIYMAGFSGWESTFGFWTEARFGWTAREVALCFVVVGIVSVACQGFLAGRLARRFGESRVLAFGCLTFGTSLMAQVFASRLWPDADWMVPAIMAVGASGMAMTMPNLSALISRSVGSPGGHAGAEHGLKLDRTDLRSDHRRGHLLADRPRLAPDHRRRHDHSGRGDGDQCRTGVPEAAGGYSFSGSLASCGSSRLALRDAVWRPGGISCQSVSRGPRWRLHFCSPSPHPPARRLFRWKPMVPCPRWNCWSPRRAAIGSPW
jgi:MFS family permease